MNDPSEAAKLWLKRKAEREQQANAESGEVKTQEAQQEREAAFAAMFSTQEAPCANRWLKEGQGRVGFAG